MLLAISAGNCTRNSYHLPSSYFFAGLVSLGLLLLPADSLAAAWTLKKDEVVIINNLFYYSTSEAFDVGGNRIRQDKFSKIEANIFSEKGLSDTVTIGISPSYQHLSQKFDSGTVDNSGLADTEIFARKKLWQNDEAVFSIQPLLKIPGPYSNSDDLPLGNKQIDGEIRALYGKTIEAFNNYHFVNLEAAYRKRFESPSDELRFEQAFGIRLSPDWLILNQFSQTYSMGDADNSAFLLTNSTDFDLMKLQFSVVRKINKEFSIQAGAFRHMSGRNTGAGSGILFSVWSSF